MTTSTHPPLPLLTASRLKTARACQRLHLYEYIQGYRPAIDAETLRFGSLLHVGLEAWWKATENRLEAARDAMAANESDPFELVRAQAMMIGYDARWGGEVFEVLAVEVGFEAPLVNPTTGAPSRTWQLGGKIDAIVRAPDGRVLIVEHKTSSEDVSPGSDYWRRLRIDGQVSMYYEGAKALGHDVQGCLYDVLSKPGLRPGAIPLLDEDGTKIVLDQTGARVRTKDGKKWRESASSADGYVLQTRLETPEEYRTRLLAAIAEDPNRYFARGEVVRLEAETGEALYDTWQLAKQLREAEVANRFPRNPDACVRFGRTCPFFGVCSGEASLDDPSLFRKLTDPNPELVDAASVAA